MKAYIKDIDLSCEFNTNYKFSETYWERDSMGVYQFKGDFAWWYLTYDRSNVALNLDKLKTRTDICHKIIAYEYEQCVCLGVYGEAIDLIVDGPEILDDVTPEEDVSTMFNSRLIDHPDVRILDLTTYDGVKKYPDPKHMIIGNSILDIENPKMPGVIVRDFGKNFDTAVDKAIGVFRD